MMFVSLKRFRAARQQTVLYAFHHQKTSEDGKCSSIVRGSFEIFQKIRNSRQRRLL